MLNKIKNKVLKNKKHPAFYHNDVYLVEFPKSGVTWLSFIVGNINLLLSESKARITFFNLHQYIIDIHQLRGNLVKESLFKVPNFRFVKSHYRYNEQYLFVVYLLRNPFDVMVSYYKFMQYIGWVSSFEEFVKHPKYGIKAWVAHVESWLDRQDDAQSFVLLRYEDMKKDAKREIKKVYDNLGIDVSDEVYDKAIDYSSFESMKSSEEMFRMSNPRYKMTFVRKGKVNSKDEIMTEQINSYIQNEAKKIINLYYPDLV